MASRVCLTRQPPSIHPAGRGRTGARSGDGGCHPTSGWPAAGRSPAGDGWPATGTSATPSKARDGNWTGWRRGWERNKKPNMLSQAQRTAILELSAKGVSKREIARVLQLSRQTVRKVLRSNSTQVPEIQRAEKAEPYRQQILELLVSCKGNLVRVHEELQAQGAVMSYAALTAFCRRHGIGQTPILPAGQYHFEPGV